MQNQTNPKPSGAPMAKLVLIAAMIVSLGALFGAIGYLAKNKAAKIQHPQVSPAAEPAKSVQDETADWKTYKNEEYGFEVKYPEDWLKNKVDLFPDYMKEAVISSLSHTFFIPQVKRIPEDVWVSISVSPCKTFFCDPREEVEEPYRKTIKQSTIKGQSIFVSDNRFEGERDLSYILVNDEKTQQVWLTLSIHHGRQNGIEYLTDEEIQPELETFNQILSTFKFTEK